MSPAAEVLRPDSAAACARALAAASEARRTVRVRGAGTKDHLGRLGPTDLTLETTALAGITEHVPGDLTVTVAAGTRFALLQEALAAAGQRLPLDPPHADAATIGGIVAANSSGFLRARYGGVRDLLIGTTTALADGTVAHAGGRVVKNVAGYDLDKLLIGSLGTLGVITECTFKVLPLPASRDAGRARLGSAADAFAAADQVARTPARPAVIAVTAAADGAWELLVAAEGDAAAVARTLRITEDAARAHGGSFARDDIDATLGGLRALRAGADAVVVRAALPPAAQRPFADTAARLDGFALCVADAASGVVRVRVNGDDATLIGAADALLAAARVCGGSARVEARPERLAQRIAPWGDGDLPGRFLMERLKAAFDPHGVLEPGRGPIG